MCRKIIATLLISLASASLASHAATSDFRDDAPDRHVVMAGDSLWSIAAKFLKDPYRWSEVWKLNGAEVKNPHRIYPGQVIILDKSAGDPQLRLARKTETEKVLPRIREDESGGPISAIPRGAIEPFLIKPLLIGTEDIKDTARVVAFNENHVLGSPGDSIYATSLPESKVKRWQIVRPGKALTDPDNGEVLGHEANVVGTAVLVRNGDPAELRIQTARTEIYTQDRLLPEPAPDIISYPLRTPEKKIRARVVSIVGDKPTGGIYHVLALSRGSRDGVELGQVLGLFRPGETLKDRYEGNVRTLTTPDERFGLLYVFRVFDRVSYALVMDSQRPISVGDVARNP